MAQEPNQIKPASAEQVQAANATAPSPSPSTTEIRSQIEQTRAEISQTIDAIQGRLSPSRLVTDAKEAVKEATVGRVKRFAAKTKDGLGNGNERVFDARELIETVNANPIPSAAAALAAVAVALAVMRSRGRSHRSSTRLEASTFNSPHEAAERLVTLPNSRGRRRRFLVGACAGLACWSAWLARNRFSETDLGSRPSQPMLRQSSEGSY
jgi:hypothetical protein